jgi:hypothetical protein
MKGLMFVVLITHVIISMEKEVMLLGNKKDMATYALKKDCMKRIIGQAIHDCDDKNKQRIENISTVKTEETVAFVFRGRLIYGEITCIPAEGKMILISNRCDDKGDPIPHGRAYNILSTPIYKLPHVLDEGTDK